MCTVVINQMCIRDRVDVVGQNALFSNPQNLKESKNNNNNKYCLLYTSNSPTRGCLKTNNAGL